MTGTRVRGRRSPKGSPGSKTSNRALPKRSEIRRLWIPVAVAAAALLVVVAMIAMQRSASSPDARENTSAQSGGQGPARVGEPMTDFRLATADGAQVTAAQLQGRDSILWFTTTYCVPCQIGALEYRGLDEELGDQAPTMLFVFLDPQEPNSALLQFRSEFGLPDWVMALDTDELAQRAGIQVLDTKIFVDETGEVRDIDTAPVNDAYLADVRRLATED